MKGSEILQGAPRAHFLAYTDYYFTEEGVLRVGIVSPFLLPALLILCVLFLVWLFKVPLRVFFPAGVDETGIIALGWLPIIVSVFITERLAAFRRHRTSNMNLDQVTGGFKQVTLIGWAQIRRVRKTVLGGVSLRLDDREYRMTASKSGVQRILEFANTKLPQTRT